MKLPYGCFYFVSKTEVVHETVGNDSRCAIVISPRGFGLHGKIASTTTAATTATSATTGYSQLVALGTITNKN